MSGQFFLSLAITAATALTFAAPVLASTAGTSGPAIAVSWSADLNEKLEEDYGVREKPVLERLVTTSLRRELPASVARVEVEVVDVVPNRPTFEQMGNTPGLSYSSFGVGGAELKGRAFDAAGTVVGEVTYRWYSSDIIWAQGNWVWDDADRAFDRFAQELAEDVTN
jgi:hypothetical protein